MAGHPHINKNHKTNVIIRCRGSSSADIRAIPSSYADAQFARCAAWSSTYSCSSAKFCHATRTSLLATASIWWRSTAGHEQTAAAVCRDSRSIGSGSISDRRFVLAMHKSGTAGRDITCCGVEAPRWPASRCCRGRFAGVTRLGITTGESTSRVSISMADPAGSSASGTSRGGDNSIRLPSEETSSQSATASCIYAGGSSESRQ